MKADYHVLTNIYSVFTKIKNPCKHKGFSQLLTGIGPVTSALPRKIFLTSHRKFIVITLFLNHCNYVSCDYFGVKQRNY